MSEIIDKQNHQQFTASFAKGLEVIRAFDKDDSHMTLTELADKIGYNRATARRFLYTLVALGYVKKIKKQFTLTPKILELGFSYFASMSWRDFAEEQMKEVVEQIKLSCSLAILDGDHITCIARASITRIISETIHVGARLPAAYTSTGRVYMTTMPDDELKKYIDTLPLQAYTKTSIVDKDVLFRHIKANQSKSYQLVDSEIEEGLITVAVPVYNKQRQLSAAINVACHKSYKNIDYLVDTVVPKLQEASKEIMKVIL